jgi:hypothetical protein
MADGFEMDRGFGMPVSMILDFGTRNTAPDAPRGQGFA